MAQLSNPPAPDGSKWRDYTTVVKIRGNPTLPGLIDLVVQDGAGKQATIRVQGAVIQGN